MGASVRSDRCRTWRWPAGIANYLIPLSVVAFFLLPLLFTVFFGRTFCASVCPLGAMQEVVAVRQCAVPRWLDQSLGMVPYLLSGRGGGVSPRRGTAFVICRYDPFVAFFRLGGNANMLVFGSLRADRGRRLWAGRTAAICVRTEPSWRCCRASRNGICASCPASASSAGCAKTRVRTVRFIRRRCRSRREQRLRGKRQLLWMFAAVPVAVAIAGLARHVVGCPAVALPSHRAAGRTDSTGGTGPGRGEDRCQRCLSQHGPAAGDCFSMKRAEWQQRFVRIGGWLGAWVGLVLSVKLVQLSIRRRRTDYHPQQTGCVSCGRCFKSCPVELVRLGLIQDVSEVVKETPA